jgi:hypothetical protein
LKHHVIPKISRRGSSAIFKQKDRPEVGLVITDLTIVDQAAVKTRAAVLPPIFHQYSIIRNQFIPIIPVMIAN